MTANDLNVMARMCQVMLLRLDACVKDLDAMKADLNHRIYVEKQHAERAAAKKVTRKKRAR